MLINELSTRTGITAHTIRFYEKSGLIHGKRDPNVKSNNYFHYDEETVERLEAIVEAKSAGFTISEISQLIDACFAETYSKEEKLNILDQKLSVLDQRIKDLKEMKSKIRGFQKDIIADKY